MAAQNAKPDEFVVRVPKIVASKTKKISVFKFNSNLGIDATHWSSNSVGLMREDNESTFVPADAQPKSGVGSEFGRMMREEARRKKMGYGSSRYSRDDQPWLLSVNLAGTGLTKGARKYKGIREGGVTQNADFWVFVKAGDGIFDAYPVDEWYNFMPVARYKTMDAEEAEEQFSKRNKILNQFALKIKEKLQDAGNLTNEDKKSVEDESNKDKKKKIEDEDDDAISTKKPSDGNKKGKKKSKKPKKKKIKDEDGDFFASADSDDGDDEGREVDYMSDSDLSRSSDDEPEDAKVRTALIGVADEDGMRNLMASDEENEENTEQQDEEEGEGGEKKKFEDFTKMDSAPTTGVDEDKASDSGSDSDDPDEDMKSPFLMQGVKTNLDAKKQNEPSTSSTGQARSSPESTTKRKQPVSPQDKHRSTSPPAKKTKVEKDSAKYGGIINEDEVRRYLQRKPQSSKDLVAKFKPKCQGIPKSDVVKSLADILKRLNPEQFDRNGTMYFSLKK